jgi:hypothetical protein
MQNARAIMKYSNPSWCTMFMPNMGREVNISGSIAQWIAQAIEVAIPSASQLNLNFIGQI